MTEEYAAELARYRVEVKAEWDARKRVDAPRLAREWYQLAVERGDARADDPNREILIKHSALTIAGRDIAAARYLEKMAQRLRHRCRRNSVLIASIRHAWRAAPRSRARARRTRTVRALARKACADPDGEPARHRGPGGRS